VCPVKIKRESRSSGGEDSQIDSKDFLLSRGLGKREASLTIFGWGERNESKENKGGQEKKRRPPVLDILWELSLLKLIKWREERKVKQKEGGRAGGRQLKKNI